MTSNPTVTIQSFGGIPNFEKKTSITGSAHVVTYKTIVKKVEQEIKILLDIGSFGDNKISIVDDLQLQGIGDLSELAAVIISHLHQDHVGRIMALIVAGYRGLFYMTHTSKAIIKEILKDMLTLRSEERNVIEEKNIRFGKKANKMLSIVENYNKKGYDTSHNKHSKEKQQMVITEEEYLEAIEFLSEFDIEKNSDIKKAYKPLPELPFDEKDVTQLLSQIRSFDKQGDYLIVDKNGVKLKAKFYPAGHVEGAAQTVLTFGYNPYKPKENHKLLYTGDLGRIKESMIIPTPSIVNDKVDQTIIESTYGNRLHASRLPEQERFIESLNISTDLHMIPAFALGRSMEVLNNIVDAIENGSLLLGEGEKIFFDCKLGKEIADILLARYPEKYKFLTHPAIEFINGTQERKKIYAQEGRKIVVAGGGMMQGGSSIPLAHKYMGNKNAIFSTVGYQASGTWGHYLHNHKGQVYTYDRHKKMKHMMYHPDYTMEKIIKRDEGENVLISGQGTRELIRIMGDLYKYRDEINLKDDEHLYLPARFWEDEFREKSEEKKKSSTVRKTKSFLLIHDREVYDYFVDKIKLIDEEEDYNEDDKYIAPGPGIHIFWDLIGKKYLKAQMKHYTSYSGHADRDELLSLLEGNKQKKTHTTILVHGEIAARKELEEHIQKNKFIPGKTLVPELYDILIFDCITGKLLEHKTQQ